MGPATFREFPGADAGTTAQRVLEGLRHALVLGEMKPGDRVRQEELAAALGVSLAPVREALAALEQEGQVTYRPRRGYVVTELDLADLREIYALRALLEDRAARRALPQLDEDARERIELAARDCVDAAARGDVAAELEANRRFHFGLLESPDQPHTLRLVRLLWDSTETYRAMYYNAPESREEATDAHDRILAALRTGDADRLAAELGAHRERALARLEALLG
ncbi:MAG TPA: GntR family transcriptional regulator [Solirubrobacterales bacterium]|nr:GntR family transcriptional regulator [Solirubrobacterales bacterium]